MNSFLAAIAFQLSLLKIRMQFDLVDCWYYLTTLQEDLKIVNVKIGYTNRADFACGKKLLHLAPRFRDGPVSLEVTASIWP